MRWKETPYGRAARDVKSVLEALDAAGAQKVLPIALAERLGQALDSFEATLRATEGVPATTIAPARRALSLLVDHRVQSHAEINSASWTAAANTYLYRNANVARADIARFRTIADAQEEDGFDILAQFLGDVERALAGTTDTPAPVWQRMPSFALACAGFLLLLAGYAAWLDYRYHANILNQWDQDVAAATRADPLARLDRLSASKEQVRSASDTAPLNGIIPTALWSSSARAEALYLASVKETLPPLIHTALDEALATEGDALALYDTLRAWRIALGRADWSRAFLAGWMAGRSEATAQIVRHLDALEGQALEIASPDPVLWAQALEIAEEASEDDRAFLELTRLDRIAALPDPRPSRALNDVSDVLVRRSGAEFDAGLQAIYSPAGWRAAKELGIGPAVRLARAEALVLFGDAGATRNDLPDHVLARLQDATLAHWSAWLSDLRIRPFETSADALMVSARLSRQNSPLAALFSYVWREVGGGDASRSHVMQLAIHNAFGPMQAYAESDGLAALSRLFKRVNVALATLPVDAENSTRVLSDAQTHSQSLMALGDAPPIIVDITEDFLVQTTSSNASLLNNDLTRVWQEQVYPLCRSVSQHFPFTDGVDAPLEEFSRLFGPKGAIARFVQGSAERYLDRSGDPWRWRPSARLAGVSQESAVFLQQALVISGGFAAMRDGVGQPLEIRLIADSGAPARVQVGGRGGKLTDGGVLSLDWPGAVPMAGAEIGFGAGGPDATVRREGDWGLIRLLDMARIRFRDEGRRALVDFRSSGGRVLFEITAPTPLNVVSSRPWLSGFSCPPVL